MEYYGGFIRAVYLQIFMKITDFNPVDSILLAVDSKPIIWKSSGIPTI